MIYTRDLVLEKIDELKAYCKENSPYKNMYGNIGGSFDWDSFFCTVIRRQLGIFGRRRPRRDPVAKNSLNEENEK